MDIVKLPIEAKSLADALTQLCEQLTSTITHQVTESVREELRADRVSSTSPNPHFTEWSSGDRLR